MIYYSVFHTINIMEALQGLLKSRRVPIYLGKDSKAKDVSFDDWLYLVTKVIKGCPKKEGQGDVSENDKYDILFNAVSGEAMSKFIRLDARGESVDDILQEFILAYSDNTPGEERLRALHNAYQGQDENVSDFVDRLDRLRYWVDSSPKKVCYDPEDTITTTFLRGLEDPTISLGLVHVRNDDATSYDDIRKLAVNLESELKSRLARKPKKVPVVENENDEVGQLISAVSSLCDKVKELETKLESSNV